MVIPGLFEPGKFPFKTVPSQVKLIPFCEIVMFSTANVPGQKVVCAVIKRFVVGTVQSSVILKFIVVLLVLVRLSEVEFVILLFL